MNVSIPARCEMIPRNVSSTYQAVSDMVGEPLLIHADDMDGLVRNLVAAKVWSVVIRGVTRDSTDDK